MWQNRPTSNLPAKVQHSSCPPSINHQEGKANELLINNSYCFLYRDCLWFKRGKKLNWSWCECFPSWGEKSNTLCQKNRECSFTLKKNILEENKFEIVFTLIIYRQKSNCIGCYRWCHVEQMPSVCAFAPLYFLAFIHWYRSIEPEGNLVNICTKMAALGAVSLELFRQEDESDGKCSGNSYNRRAFRVY